MTSDKSQSGDALCSVAILAGGFGTRLQSRSKGLPKPMVEILGKPLLAHQIEACHRYGFVDIALLVHHQHDAISEYFGDGSRFDVNIRYSIESDPRGTAGALYDALPLLQEEFLVLYGDTFFDVDLRRFRTAHPQGSQCSLFLHPNDHPHDSDLVDMDEDGRVLAIFPYPHPEGLACRNLVNAALYTFSREGLADVLPAQGKGDLAKHSFPEMLRQGRRITGYKSEEYIKDMGTPERLDKVEAALASGLPEKLSLRSPRKAIFLDRDGTVNSHRGHLSDAAQLDLIEGAGRAVRRINQAGALAVVITNQPVLARGELDRPGLERIHQKLDQLLGLDGAYLDGLYFCPHHPDPGYEGEVPELKMDCACRKPKSGLIDKAVSDMFIDRRQSWMIGDTTSDLKAGQSAGLRTILVETGEAGSDAKHPVAPDFIFPTLEKATDWAMEGHAAVYRKLSAHLHRLSKSRLISVSGSDSLTRRCITRVLAEGLQHCGKTAYVAALSTSRDLPYSALAAGTAPSAISLPLWPKIPKQYVNLIRAIGLDDILVIEIDEEPENPLPQGTATVIVEGSWPSSGDAFDTSLTIEIN